MAKRRVVFKDQELAMLTGVLLTLAGALCFRDAFEDRGQPRPWPLRLLGLVT